MAIAGLAVALALPAGAGTVSPEVTRRSAVVQVVERLAAAVVNISTTQLQVRRDPLFEEFFGSLFEPGRRVEQRASLGSGIIVDRTGLVVTNAHVVEGAHRIFVAMEDEETVPATLVGVDATADLAVLRIETRRALRAIDLDHGEAPLIGETVIAIGNPFGLSHTVTVGVVSALDRSIRTDDRVYHRFLQTDASINPGNSGGPLLNVAGELVGINAAIYARGEGIGFAIPRARVQQVVHALTSEGSVSPAWAGWLLAGGARGATLAYVAPESPAALAGFMVGAELLKLGQVGVRDVDDCLAVVAGSLPKEELAVRFRRAGQVHEGRLRLDRYRPEAADRIAATLLGVGVGDGQGQGVGRVVVQRVIDGGWALQAGIRPGDWIRGVGQLHVQGKAEFDAALGLVFFQRSLPLEVERAGVSYLLRLQW